MRQSEKKLVECDCDLDIPAFRALMWRAYAHPHPTTYLPIDLDVNGHAVELPAATPWRDAGKQLAAGTVWLTVK